MIVPINSSQFADAWRTVSESLLAFLQNGGLNSVSAASFVNNSIQSISSEIQKVSTSESQQPVVEIKPRKTVCDELYATCPIRQADGSYKFKSLREEKGYESTYKIFRFTDGTCEFELCNLTGEARQIFKDNKDTRMPSAVGILIGEIGENNSICNQQKGKGIVEGKSVKITEPLTVEFKS